MSSDSWVVEDATFSKSKLKLLCFKGLILNIFWILQNIFCCLPALRGRLKLRNRENWVKKSSNRIKLEVIIPYLPTCGIGFSSCARCEKVALVSTLRKGLHLWHSGLTYVVVEERHLTLFRCPVTSSISDVLLASSSVSVSCSEVSVVDPSEVLVDPSDAWEVMNLSDNSSDNSLEWNNLIVNFQPHNFMK